MAFQVSPGINTSEIDLTTVIPSVATTEAGMGGVFGWGPIGKLSLISSENELVTKYGSPTNNNYETFFTAANFLAYSNALYISRAAVTTGFSNTLSSDLNGNTTLVIADPSTGITVGLGVYGEGIPDGATVATVTSNTTDTIIEMDQAATLGNSTVVSAETLNFFDTDIAFNAVANSAAAVDRIDYTIKNSDDIDNVSIPVGVEYVAKYPGNNGNSLKVSVCDTSEQYGSTVNPFALDGYTNTTIIPGPETGFTLDVNATTGNVVISNSATLDFSTTYTAAGALRDSFVVGDVVEVGNTSIGKQQLKIKTVGLLQNTNPQSPSGEVYFDLVFEQPFGRSANWSANTVDRKWEYSSVVDSAPGTSLPVADLGRTETDQLSVVVVDQDGKFSGTSGSILEVYQNLSRATNARNSDGTSNYYKTVINDTSRYVWNVNDRSGASSANTLTVVDSTETNPFTGSFGGGSDGITESDGSITALASAYDLLSDAKTIDLSLVLAGKSVGVNDTQLANYLIDNIAEVRKDCVVFVSPARADVVGTGVTGTQADNVVEFRNNMRSSSYAFLDSGYKRQYDKYNDVLRYIPLNGDVAGLAARTDDVRDPWWSPAGFNRGQIKNLTNLAWNPNHTERDALYKNDANPVVSFQGSGTILYGDKTALGRPSAFDRINVRRLFIVLEKAIATAAESTLFEFNDDFTRAQFKNLVEPFLRDIQGRRGISDFRVVCDETNNTQEVIDGNRFVGDIYIKPAKSINFIQLNFVAVRSGVEFSEIVGKF